MEKTLYWSRVKDMDTMLQNLRTLRKDRGCSQLVLADWLGIAQSTYSRYESGERPLPLYRLVQLALFYSVSIDYLLGRTQDPTPYPPSKRPT